MPSYMDDLQAIDHALGASGLVTDYSDVYAATVFDKATMTFTIRYKSDADAGRVAEFLEKYRAIPDTEEITLADVGVAFTEASVYAQALNIMQNRESWAAQLGVSEIVTTGTDLVTGEVNVGVKDDVPESHAVVNGIALHITGNAAVQKLFNW